MEPILKENPNRFVIFYKYDIFILNKFNGRKKNNNLWIGGP